MVIPKGKKKPEEDNLGFLQSQDKRRKNKVETK